MTLSPTTAGWLLSVVIAVLTGALGLVCGGLILNACVSWYRISSFEGGSGYAVIAGALGGGVLGVILGLATSRLLAAWGSLGFLTGLGSAWGAALLLAGGVAGIARLLAHVPPTLQGHPLALEVEIRLPVGETRNPLAVATTAAPEQTRLTLACLLRHVQRATQDGTLDIARARQEDGRWIVPGSVPLFTERGDRGVAALLAGKSIAEFILPVPARPGAAQESWSPWYPQPPAGQPAWPDSKPSIRYRVRQEIPPPPEPDPREVEAAAFAALPEQAPLSAILPHLDFHSNHERIVAVMKRVRERPEEFAGAIRSEDTKLREHALIAVMNLNPAPDPVRQAMLEEGRALAAGLAKLAAAGAGTQRDLVAEVDLRDRGEHWLRAWPVHARYAGTDPRPMLRELAEASAHVVEGTPLASIAAAVRDQLGSLEAPSTAR